MAIDTSTGEIHENSVSFGGYDFVARRNVGEDRYQVFVGTELSPVGYIERHAGCDTYAGFGFRTFDASNRPLFTAKPGRDDGCVASYNNALLPLVLRLRGVA